MDLNDLLRKNDIDPQRVLVFRHRPPEPELKKFLPWLAAEKPDVFNAYQQTQQERVEKAMAGGAEYVASFLGHEPGRALFVGLYKIGGSKRITREEYWQVPAYVEMKKFGMKGFTEESGRSSCLWFDLVLTEFCASWKGKLIVDWPARELAWWRWAHRNTFAVQAILEDSSLVRAMTEWDNVVFAWEELKILPRRWQSALSQWRGIYIFLTRRMGKDTWVPPMARATYSTDGTTTA